MISHFLSQCPSGCQAVPLPVPPCSSLKLPIPPGFYHYNDDGLISPSGNDFLMPAFLWSYIDGGWDFPIGVHCLLLLSVYFKLNMRKKHVFRQSVHSSKLPPQKTQNVFSQMCLCLWPHHCENMFIITLVRGCISACACSL